MNNRKIIEGAGKGMPAKHNPREKKKSTKSPSKTAGHQAQKNVESIMKLEQEAIARRAHSR